MLYEIHYRRIEEGSFFVEADSMEHAQSLLRIELACGTAPVEKSENFFIDTIEVKDGVVA